MHEFLVVSEKNHANKTLVKFILGSDIFIILSLQNKKHAIFVFVQALNFMSFNIVMGWTVSPEKDKYLSPNPQYFRIWLYLDRFVVDVIN